MPTGNRTGPTGAGPMTGRSAGYCAGYSVPGYMNPIPGRTGGFGFGRGWGRGMGRGFGWRHRYWATGLPGWASNAYGYPAFEAYPFGPEPTPKQETDMLMREAEALRAQLEEVQSRIETLEKAEKASKAEE